MGSPAQISHDGRQFSEFFALVEKSEENRRIRFGLSGLPPGWRLELLGSTAAGEIWDERSQCLARGVLQIGIDDLEGARQGKAQSAGDGRKPDRGFIAVSEVEGRLRGQMIQDRPELDLLVHLPERVNALLQPFGDREVERLDDVATVCLCRCLAANEQIVYLVVDEIAVTLEVLLVDVEAGRDPEEALEPGHTHDMWGRRSLVWSRRNHGSGLTTEHGDCGRHRHDERECLQHEVLGIGDRAIVDLRENLDGAIVAVSEIPPEISVQRSGSEQVRNPPLPNLQRQPDIAVHGADEHQPAKARERRRVDGERDQGCDRARNWELTRLFQG